MTRGVKPSTIVAGSSPVTEVPRPPSYLSKEAKAEWRKAAAILVLERKVLTVADLPTLENYIIAVDTMRQLYAELRTHGHVLASGKRNPASTALGQAMQQQLRAAEHLGLTPTARSRTSIVEPPDEEGNFL